MYSEANRRETFTSWPHVGYRWAQPDPMAQAGFYHQVRDLLVLSIWFPRWEGMGKEVVMFLSRGFFSLFNGFLQLCINHKKLCHSALFF